MDTLDAGTTVTADAGTAVPATTLPVAGMPPAVVVVVAAAGCVFLSSADICMAKR